jgi:4-amino-4-deoxy-L-arabinose transferase-like glycosyltransferase
VVGALRRGKFDAALHVLIALLLAYKLAYHALFLLRSPFARATFSDAQVYEHGARDILAHPPWGTQPFYLQGAYSYALAAALAFVDDLRAAIFGQLLIMLIAYAAFYWLARFAFGPRAAALSTALLLAYHGLSFYENKLLTAAMAVACNIAVLFTMARYDQRPSELRAGMLGVCSAIAVLARPNMILALPISFACLSWRAPRERRIQASLAFALGAAVSFAPMMVRNGIVTGQYGLFRTHGGGTPFYVGNNPHAEGLISSAGGLVSGQVGVEQEELSERLGLPATSDPQERARSIERELYRRAFAFIAEQPLEWLALELRKLRLTLGNAEFSQDYDPLGERQIVPEALSWGLPFWLLLLLGGSGVLGGIPGPTGWLALGHFAAVLLTNLAFFTSAQHRLPLVVPLALFAGRGAQAWWNLRSSSSTAHRVGLAGVLVAVGLLALLPPRPPRTRTTLAHHFNLAVAYQELGAFSAAADELGRVIERSPQRVEAWLERARCYRHLQRWSEAERDIAQARSLGPLPAWLSQELATEQAAIRRARSR